MEIYVITEPNVSYDDQSYSFEEGEGLQGSRKGYLSELKAQEARAKLEEEFREINDPFEYYVSEDVEFSVHPVTGAADFSIDEIQEICRNHWGRPDHPDAKVTRAACWKVIFAESGYRDSYYDIEVVTVADV